MDKQMIVILRTMMNRKSVATAGNPNAYQFVEEHTKYRFTLEEAFSILQNMPFMFEKMVLHNVCMRDILREVGARVLVDELCEMFSPNDKLKLAMESFVEKWEGKKIADFDIQIVSKFDTIDLGFGKIHGLEELESLVEKSLYANFVSKSSIREREPQKVHPLHVGEVWTPYPKFDSYDAADNRSYQNFIVCRIPISDTDLKELAFVDDNNNCCRVHEKTPAKLLPVIYYDGDSGFMLLAKLKNVHLDE